MDPDHPDWIVISAASPKTRSGPKPIPVVLPNQASSLAQPLKRGGKTVPPFERPNPYPVQLESKQPPTLSSSRRVCVSPARDSHLRVSAAKLSAPRRPSAPQQTRTQKFASDLTLRWLALINSIGCLSQVWVDFQASAHFDQHCIRLLDKFGQSTVFKYIGTLQCIFVILSEFSLTWQDVGTHRISDLLQIAHEGRQTDWGFGATSAIKSLRWAQKILQITAWDILFGSVVNSFLSPQIHERREAIPLSLYIITQWERRVP